MTGANTLNKFENLMHCKIVSYCITKLFVSFWKHQSNEAVCTVASGLKKNEKQQNENGVSFGFVMDLMEINFQMLILVL